MTRSGIGCIIPALIDIEQSCATTRLIGTMIAKPAMALRFVLSNPDISTACSGMNTMEQLEQNVRTVKEFDPDKDASHEEMCEGVDRLRKSFGDKTCTKCGYCVPCPNNINIPLHMESHLNWKAFGFEKPTVDAIKAVAPKESAANCDDCGTCEEKCPNTIPIRERLKELLKLAK
jgi:predicted aldo/keto reductase-like oxidoreductase